MAMNIELLKKESIWVYDGMVAVLPQFGQESTLNLSELVPKFDGCFAANNSTVAFISDNKFFVTPYTRKVMETLKAAGFAEKYFCVPFSNWDYPKYQQAKWEFLRMKANESYHQDFIKDCTDYCDKHGIGAIDEKILANCFRIPTQGLWAKYPNFQKFITPTLSSYCFDSYAAMVIGKYNCNNGKVVFIYRDGTTYVAKGYKIIPILQEAGYEDYDLFVPFSNNEEITDPVFKARWEEIEKF